MALSFPLHLHLHHNQLFGLCISLSPFRKPPIFSSPKKFLIERDFHCLHLYVCDFLMREKCVRSRAFKHCVRFKNFIVNNNQNIGLFVKPCLCVRVCVFQALYCFNLMHSWKVKFPLKSHIFPMLMMVMLVLLLYLHELIISFSSCFCCCCVSYFLFIFCPL